MTQLETPTGKVPEAVRVWLLGGFRVSVGSRTIEGGLWRLRKAASLVKLLSLAPAHRLHREQIMEALWPELGTNAASNNLRMALHAARRILAPDPSAGPRYLLSEADLLVLCPQGELWVDTEAFEAAALFAQRSREPGAYESAIDLYAGELLPEDRYEEWAEAPRRELNATYASLLLGLAWTHEERQDYGSALEALRRVTRKEPTNEEAHVGLMRLYALSGRRADALRQYELLEEIIYQERRREPSASTRAFREEVATGRFPIEGARPVRLSSEPPQHNLPIPRTSFVGRGRELTEVKRTLAMTRLLTLTGAGGSGKTRLALQAATNLGGAYPDGVWIVELAELSEPELIPQEIADALGVREQPDRPLVEVVAENIREKTLLLVLDNCEHLIDAAAHLVDFLFASCPHLKVMATSREPLGVEGEILFTVPPLALPVELPADPSEAARTESVRLFVERTRLRVSSFSLNQGNVRPVAEVCRRLEGIPLAIELAAARMGTLATDQMAQRLEDSLGLLAVGPRTAAPRQRTMRATIGWSYELLSDPEKETFGRLSVFSGGFTLVAAEAVCPGGGIGEREILNHVSSLVTKSLVVAETTADGQVRYRMLEPVRQYARERLEERGEVEAIRHKHANFFLALAERAEPELKGPGQVVWLELLEEENDNLRAAMAWLLEEGEIQSAVRLAWALWQFWLIHGYQGEGRRWIEEALAKGENLAAHARAKALCVQAAMYYGLSSPEELERLCQEAAALFRLVGDRRGLAYTLVGQAYAQMQRGDVERAISLFEESYLLAREAGDKWAMCGGLVGLGSTYLGLGDYEQAARYLEEALALSREIGNKFSESSALYGLALAEHDRDDQKRAAELYAKGLRSSTEAGDKANVAYCLEGLAQVAVAQGEPEHAAQLFGAAEAALEAASGALYAYVQDRSLHDQAVDAIRSRLDETSFSAAWAKGATMSVGEVVEYALSGEKPAPVASPTVLRQPPSATRPVALTRREQEVATLIAQGLTNRQIATELSISEYTVANHVAKILNRLGLSSRSQITAWVVKR